MHALVIAAVIVIAFNIAFAMWKRNQLKDAAAAEAKAIEQSLASYAKEQERKAGSALRGAADKIEKL